MRPTRWGNVTKYTPSLFIHFSRWRLSSTEMMLNHIVLPPLSHKFRDKYHAILQPYVSGAILCPGRGRALCLAYVWVHKHSSRLPQTLNVWLNHLLWDRSGLSPFLLVSSCQVSPLWKLFCYPFCFYWGILAVQYLITTNSCFNESIQQFFNFISEEC